MYFNLKSGNSFLIFNCYLVPFRHFEIEIQSLACNVLEVPKELEYYLLLVITSRFIRNADARPSNKTRIQGCQPRDTSRYNLKIQLQVGSFLPIALHPRMQRNDSRKICRYRTSR